MNDDIDKTLKSLKKNEFDVKFAEDITSACRLIMDLIPEGSIVGIGDSATVRHIGVIPELETRGTALINPFAKELADEMDKRRAEMWRSQSSDIFLTSSNAVTLDGKIVNIDMTGNRVGGMIFGIPKVILAVSRNKIVRDAEAAVDRIKNIIAPYHCKFKGRKTPCAVNEKCIDCDAPHRVCRITTILEKKPFLTDVTVILIDEDLGLSWDPEWEEERIERIRRNYEAFTYPPSLPKK